MAGKAEVAEQSTQGTQVATKVNDKFITGLINQVQQKQELGLTFPARYNPANELMGAYLILKEATDKNGKPVLEVCSTESIATSLMRMVNGHLSALKGQCYLIPYGGKLQCQPSVYGNEANAKDNGMKDINASVIYEGDTFKYHKEDGKTVIDVHEQDFMNIDMSKIKGVYAVAIMQDGTKKAEVMNMNQVKTAWQQGYGYKENGNGTHQKFPDQMAMKTVKNRLTKDIIRGGGDAELINAYDDFDEHEADDRTAIDVAYEIETYGNQTEFTAIEEKPATQTMADVTGKSENKEPVLVENAGDKPLPDFMKQ